MAELNLNFHKVTGRYKPTKSEIVQIEGLALSVEAILKTLNAYANENNDSGDMGGVVMGVCNALGLLIDPIIGYLSNYAGDLPTPEEAEKTA